MINMRELKKAFLAFFLIGFLAGAVLVYIAGDRVLSYPLQTGGN